MWWLPSLQERVDAARGKQLLVPRRDVGVEPPALRIDVVLKQTLGRRELVEGPVDRALCLGLIVRHVESLVVRQGKSIPHVHALRGVEGEHLLDSLDASLCRLRVDRRPRLLGARGHLLDEVPRRAAGRQPLEVFLRRRSDDRDDFLDLVKVVLASEDGLAADELTEDAPDRPDVDGLCVLAGKQDHLRRSVPARHDIVCEGRVVLVVPEATGEAEVADFQVAVLVHQNIGGLQVAVHDIGAVEVQEPAEDLVREVLVVLVIQQLLGVDHAVKVCLHEVRDDVNVVEVRRFWRVHVQDADNIVVPKAAKQLDLAEDPLAVNEVMEGVRDLLDRKLVPRLWVLERGHGAVGA
mmetsp:Transcript_78805/g.170338  ORF Transcript_78805/g.170338 Transcript_78805/m.170338 type:complete len:351 (-) Transcript_78805:244-1296(-)